MVTKGHETNYGVILSVGPYAVAHPKVSLLVPLSQTQTTYLLQDFLLPSLPFVSGQLWGCQSVCSCTCG